MRKTSILFLIVGAFIGFFFGVKALEHSLNELKGEDDDDPEPAIDDDPVSDPASDIEPDILKTVACKPWCRLV
jgi:hypothetical protein